MIPETTRVNKIPPLRAPPLKEYALDTVPEIGCSDGRNDETKEGLGDGVDCGAIELGEFRRVELAVFDGNARFVGDCVGRKDSTLSSVGI